MKVNDNNKDYRRGVILGLTMAEIMILIIFLLMLAFAALLQQTKDENKIYKELFSKNEALVQRIVQIIQTTSSESDEIVRILEKLPRVIKKIQSTNVVLDKKEDISSIIEKGVNSYLEQQAALSRAVDAENGLSPEAQLQIELDKNKALSERLVALEKTVRDGFGPPPCWDPGNRRYTEFIYQAELTSNGIVLSDITAPRWTDEKAKLSTEKVTLGKAISVRTFSEQVVGLWAYSLKNDCRLLVRVVDRTLPHEKDLYKAMYQAVYDKFMLSVVRRVQPILPPLAVNAEKLNNKHLQEEKPKAHETNFFERLF